MTMNNTLREDNFSLILVHKNKAISMDPSFFKDLESHWNITDSRRLRYWFHLSKISKGNLHWSHKFFARSFKILVTISTFSFWWCISGIVFSIVILLSAQYFINSPQMYSLPLSDIRHSIWDLSQPYLFFIK